MKTIKTIFICSMLLYSTWCFSGEEKQYWYLVTIDGGDKMLEYFGSSTKEPAQFMESLLSEKYVRLDNLRIPRPNKDNTGTMFMSWDNWSPIVKSFMFINTKIVKTVHPLKHDPRDQK